MSRLAGNQDGQEEPLAGASRPGDPHTRTARQPIHRQGIEERGIEMPVEDHKRDLW
jgi:hypothetical protein